MSSSPLSSFSPFASSSGPPGPSGLSGPSSGPVHPSTSPPTFTHAANQLAEAVHSHASYALANVKSFIVTRSITFWIVFGLAVAVLLGMLIYYLVVFYRYWNRYINCPGCYIRYADQNANVIERMPVNARLLTQPQNGYTYSMWLYLANWYNAKGYNNWKPVYCRANIPPDCGRLSWDMVPYQQPGIWLEPTVNNLRVVVTTGAYLPAQCGSSSAASGESPDSDTGDTGANGCTVTDLSAPLNNKHILEYVDLNNVPIGQWFNLCIVVTKSRVELYMNGRLAQTQVLVGNCELNHDSCTTEAGHFAPGNAQYTARMTNFRYMPLAVPAQMVQVLYDEELRNPVLGYANPLNSLSKEDGGECWGV